MATCGHIIIIDSESTRFCSYSLKTDSKIKFVFKSFEVPDNMYWVRTVLVDRSKLYLYMNVLLLLEKLTLMQKYFLDSKKFFGKSCEDVLRIDSYGG